MTHCKNCGATVETEDGILDLNEDGLCEDCADRLHMAKIRKSDDRAERQAEYDDAWPAPPELPPY